MTLVMSGKDEAVRLLALTGRLLLSPHASWDHGVMATIVHSAPHGMTEGRTYWVRNEKDD